MVFDGDYIPILLRKNQEIYKAHNLYKLTSINAKMHEISSSYLAAHAELGYFLNMNKAAIKIRKVAENISPMDIIHTDKLHPLLKIHTGKK